jgi:cytochrome c5
MSEAQHPSDSQGGPVGLSSKQIFLGTTAAVVVAVLAGVLLGQGPAPVQSSSDAEAVSARIQPVGAVAIKLEGGPAKTGEEVYKAQCSACHAGGLAGAPKFGDAGAWGPRLASGYAALLNSAVKGKGAMGAQGGGDFSEYEIGRAVVYMTAAAGGKFEEPKAPDAAASK